MTRDPAETTNGDTMMALGRALSYALDETSLQPDARVSENLLSADPIPTTYIQIVKSGSSRGWIGPKEMEALMRFQIAVEAVERDHWENTLYAEFRTQIPDEVIEAYEKAVEHSGVPEPPQEWDEEFANSWMPESVMDDFGPEE